MTQYRPKLNSRWCDDLDMEIETPQITVFEADDGIPTGVLDKNGNELLRYERVPLGFIK